MRLRHLALPAALSVLGAAASIAVLPAQAVTSATGFVPERLARIDTWVDGLIKAQQIPGAVVMIVHDGKVVVHKAYGVRELGAGAPIKTDDIFRMASQTKAITSTAVMMLYEEGKIGLDDPIENYIPAFKDQKVMVKFNPADSSYESRPAKRKTTIRQLLTHTGGLDYADIGSDDFKAIYAKAGLTALGREGDVLADKINALGRMPLKQDPGERFTYSLSIDVLGRLVEIVSGMPLDQFFRTRIFEPLKMRDTWFELPADRRSRLVTLHQDKDGKLTPVHTQDGPTHPDFPARKVTYFSGGGGLSGTTADYARFLQMYLNKGELDGVRLLGRKTIEMMLTNQIGALQPAYGLGFALETPEVDFRSPVSAGTFSWGGAFKTTYWADPKERVVALFYTNIQSAINVENAFRALVNAAIR